MGDPIEPWPIVRRGDQGHPVITLQELLRAHGQHIAADGVFGPATEAAVKAVQTSRGVPADGGPGAFGERNEAIANGPVQLDGSRSYARPDPQPAVAGAFDHFQLG